MASHQPVEKVLSLSNEAQGRRSNTVLHRQLVRSRETSAGEWIEQALDGAFLVHVAAWLFRRLASSESGTSWS